MNIDAVTRGLINRFVPHLGKQLDSVVDMQIAFSVALRRDQQSAVADVVKKGASHFINWSETEAGKAAIQAFADAYIGAPVVPAEPQRPADLVKEKSNDVA